MVQSLPVQRLEAVPLDERRSSTASKENVKMVTSINFRKEVELLIACARVDPSAEVRKRIGELVHSDLDWDYTLQLADRHGVLALLYWNLKDDDIPISVEHRLQLAFTRNVEMNLFRTREMLNVLSLFEDLQIPALCFKGPLLALLAYGNVGLRQFSDLDILVKKRHLHRARQHLLAHGYTLGVALSWWQTQFPLLSKRKDNILVKRDQGIVVELHGKLSGSHFRFPLSLGSLLPTLAATEVGGKKVCDLPPETLLSYLCLHGSRHSWERLLWISDVAQIVRSHDELDWASVVEQARELGNRRTLALGLLLARDLLDAPVPRHVLDQLEIEPATESLALSLRNALFQAASGEKGITYWHELHLRMRERFSDRLRLRAHYCRRYLRQALVPNELDHAMIALPRELSFLYYLLRSFRLSKQFFVSRVQKTFGIPPGPMP